MGALSNKGRRGQRNREEIGVGATFLAASTLVRPARQNRHATQANSTLAAACASYYLPPLANNTEDHFSWEPEKINVKFYKNCENTRKILKISFVRCHFVKLDMYFSDSHEKFSLVLLQITNYIYSP